MEVHQTPSLQGSDRINAAFNHGFGETTGATLWQQSYEILQSIHGRLT